MKNDVSENYLSYLIYQDDPQTMEWGDTSWGDTYAAPALENTGTGGLTTHTAYGTIGVGQSAPTGNYSDAVNVTINY